MKIIGNLLFNVFGIIYIIYIVANFRRFGSKMNMFDRKVIVSNKSIDREEGDLKKKCFNAAAAI